MWRHGNTMTFKRQLYEHRDYVVIYLTPLLLLPLPLIVDDPVSEHQTRSYTDLLWPMIFNDFCSIHVWCARKIKSLCMHCSLVVLYRKGDAATCCCWWAPTGARIPCHWPSLASYLSSWRPCSGCSPTVKCAPAISRFDSFAQFIILCFYKNSHFWSYSDDVMKIVFIQ